MILSIAFLNLTIFHQVVFSFSSLSQNQLINMQVEKKGDHSTNSNNNTAAQGGDDKNGCASGPQVPKCEASVN